MSLEMPYPLRHLVVHFLFFYRRLILSALPSENQSYIFAGSSNAR